TERQGTGPSPSEQALNVGRGLHPGDGLPPPDPATRRRGRSTWAGVFTPATGPARMGALSLPVGRSTWAGVFTPATVPPCAPESGTARSALNVGRGLHPGDGTEPHAHRARCHRAQRGPGSSPRRRLEDARKVRL